MIPCFKPSPSDGSTQQLTSIPAQGLTAGNGGTDHSPIAPFQLWHQASSLPTAEISTTGSLQVQSISQPVLSIVPHNCRYLFISSNLPHLLIYCTIISLNQNDNLELKGVSLYLTDAIFTNILTIQNIFKILILSSAVIICGVIHSGNSFLVR